jgi:tRNA pseudouridine55 synthase
MAKKTEAGPHGVLIVDKPSGPTSHDIVAQARRHFHTRRVGHAGTLDPMATGVLVLLLGEATKLSDVATCTDKRYVAELRFGRSTDSHDADGTTTEERAGAADGLDEATLRAALAVEKQRELQQPPVVSALKVAGQRAYRLSRAGRPPDLAARPVRVHSLELLAWSPQGASLELLVSKGYYVRALVRDVALTLGIPAHLCGLRRLQSGSFGLAEACSWPPSEPITQLIPLPLVLPRLLPTLRLTSDGILRARRGQPLGTADFLDAPDPGEMQANGVPSPTLWAWTDRDGAPIALGQRDEKGFRVRRGFSADPLPEVESKTALVPIV